jgi:hypothetical protein
MEQKPGIMLVVRAYWQLLLYDLVNAVAGFRGVHAMMRRTSVAERPLRADCSEIREAVRWARALYGKRVLCLQISVATARLLRQMGIDAQLIVGYRPTPFFGHAWVEVGGTVFNDSAAYQEKLTCLFRL